MLSEYDMDTRAKVRKCREHIKKRSQEGDKVVEIPQRTSKIGSAQPGRTTMRTSATAQPNPAPAGYIMMATPEQMKQFQQGNYGGGGSNWGSNLALGAGAAAAG